MKQHKIVAQILVILSVFNYALAAPVLARGIREVRVNVVDVTEDVTTALRKRWIPLDASSTNAADGANAPPSPASSDSVGNHWLELGLGPPDPESPPPTPYSMQGSVDWDYSHPFGPPPPVDDDLPFGHRFKCPS